MRSTVATNMLSDTETYGVSNFAPVGGGLLKCTSPIKALKISNTNLSKDYFYGVGSRVIVWGCKV